MKLQEKSTNELEDIILLPDIYGPKTIKEAKEIISERKQVINDLRENEGVNLSEDELLSITIKQQKDINNIKNYMLFFVVITVIGLFASFFLTIIYLNPPR